MDSVIRRVVGVAAGAFAPGHLGELTRIVPFEMVDAVLAQTGAQQRRVRDLPFGSVGDHAVGSHAPRRAAGCVECLGDGRARVSAA